MQSSIISRFFYEMKSAFDYKNTISSGFHSIFDQFIGQLLRHVASSIGKQVNNWSFRMLDTSRKSLC